MLWKLTLPTGLCTSEINWPLSAVSLIYFGYWTELLKRSCSGIIVKLQMYLCTLLLESCAWNLVHNMNCFVDRSHCMCNCVLNFWNQSDLLIVSSILNIVETYTAHRLIDFWNKLAVIGSRFDKSIRLQMYLFTLFLKWCAWDRAHSMKILLLIEQTVFVLKFLKRMINRSSVVS
jgi:hypothetical protein